MLDSTCLFHKFAGYNRHLLRMHDVQQIGHGSPSQAHHLSQGQAPRSRPPSPGSPRGRARS